MTALALLICVPPVMWLAQTLSLKTCGLPIRYRLDTSGTPEAVRITGRIATQGSLAAVALIYPLLRGESIIDYYGRLLPMDIRAKQCLFGAGLTVLFLSVLYLAWVASDMMRVAPHLQRPRTLKRLLVAPCSAAFGAFVEEIIFRGVVMADLLRTPSLSIGLVVAISAVVFAGAHYVRSVKRRWTIPGHLALGFMLSVAFLRTETLWLAIGLHAGGILMIMSARAVLKYRGPAWLTGESIYPFAGVVGVAGLLMLTGFIDVHFR